jgi:hypothetical protein
MIGFNFFKGDKEVLALRQKLIHNAMFGFIVLSSFFYACSKGEIKGPEAVKELIVDLKSKNPDCTCDPYINQYLWRNENVYVLAYKGPACDWAPVFYDSKGQKFTLDAGYSFEEFLQESTLIKNTWVCR